MNKPKFNPIVTRVKLNPEQAVLACSCYGSNRAVSNTTRNANRSICQANVCRNNVCNRSNSGSSART
jgi:hypothetical protein